MGDYRRSERRRWNDSLQDVQEYEAFVTMLRELDERDDFGAAVWVEITGFRTVP